MLQPRAGLQRDYCCIWQRLQANPPCHATWRARADYGSLLKVLRVMAQDAKASTHTKHATLREPGGSRFCSLAVASGGGGQYCRRVLWGSSISTPNVGLLL